MKKLVFAVLFLFVLCGCAAKKRHPVAIGAEIFERQSFSVIDIPSHGAISDGLAIAVGGGANSSNIRNKLLDIQKANDTKNVLVTSTNSLLAKTLLANAVKDLEPGSLASVYLVFAGNENHGKALQSIIEKTGARYERFIR